ncbi:MAG: NUDIX hydrolase [Cyclobacteriaceae bacterium]
MTPDFPVSSSIYHKKLRVRVCGLLEVEGKILLLKHLDLGSEGYIWSPPGGGITFGESAEETLIKEFKEETNLEIEVRDFLFINEYRDSLHHAVELFFKVILKGGELALGFDPEVPDSEQILTEAKFWTYDEIAKTNSTTLHNCFTLCDSPKKIFDLRGFYKFDNI